MFSWLRATNFTKISALIMLSAVVASCRIPSLPNDLVNAPKDMWEASRSRSNSVIDDVSALNDLSSIDPEKGLSRKDYKDTFYIPPIPTAKKLPNEPLLPDVTQLMAEPSIPIVGSDKLVTITVTDDIPIKEILLELSRRADIDIEIDPGIEGGIILRAIKKPFSEVIERIARLANIRYSVENGVLRVERDLPYVYNYRLDFLNLSRTTNSSVSITSTLLGGAGDGGSNISTGSQASLKAESAEGDMWAIVENGIKSILANYQHIEELDEDDADSDTDIPYNIDEDSNLEEVLGAVEGLRSLEKAKSIVKPADKSAILSVNRQAGVVNILATQKQHNEIAKYLKDVSEVQSAQVIIETKIVEVSLNDQYRGGIDWSLVSNNITPLTATSSFNNVDPLKSASTDMLSLVLNPSELFGLDDSSLNATIQLVEEFGNTRTISSPRVSTMNNQFAVLTFAENFVYFQVTLEEETEDNSAGDTNTLTVQSEIKTVPVGVIMAIQPSINLDTNEITMNIRPTLSRVTGQVADPGVSLIAANAGITGINSNVPIIEVRELDTVLKMQSGQVMVIGGLMEERVVNNDRGVPGISGLPLVGNLFKSVSRDTEIVETVIFIKATVVPGRGHVNKEDKEFYKKYGRTRSSVDF